MRHLDSRRSSSGGQGGKYGGSLWRLKPDRLRKQRPGNFLGKMTSVVATVFMLTSLALSYSATHKTSSVMEKVGPQAQQQTMPAPAEKAPLPPEQNAPAGQQK